MVDVREVTRTLAQFAVNADLAHMPVVVVDRAKLIILDTVGVSIAALDFPIGRIVVEYATAMGGESPTAVIGTTITASAPLTAQVNGTLAHALDFDDHGHLSTHVLPASLAVGQLTRASGAEVLEAYIAGREVGARLSAVIEAKRKQKQGPTYRGWYRVGVVGPVAAAVAAGKLLKLDAPRMGNAVAIACSSSAGLRRNLGTMTKALHAGNAAAGGVTAAMLASRGFSGDPEVIEAPLGLLNAVCLPGESDLAPLDSLGAPFELEEQIAAKRFPACSPSHIPIEAVLRLRARHSVDPTEVVAVQADLHEFSLLRSDPTEAIATGYSLPYLLSIALIDGRVGLDQVGEARLTDPRVRDMMLKVTHDPDAAPSGKPERVTVRLATGAVLHEEVDRKPDFGDESSITAKFVECVGRRLPDDQVCALRNTVGRLESVSSIDELLVLTVASTSRRADLVDQHSLRHRDLHTPGGVDSADHR